MSRKYNIVGKMEESGLAQERKSLPAAITMDDLYRSSMHEKACDRLLQIVQTALELFHAKGYDATTTRDIGKACNIAPGGHLYYYIKSKEDFPRLFREIAENDTREWTESIYQEIEHLPPDELLERAVREYAYSMHVRRKMVAFWYHAAVQVRSEDYLKTMDSEVGAERLIQKIIDRGNMTGHFKVKDPYILAINIIMMCQTWALKRWLIRDNRTIDQYIDTIVELVMKMVRGSTENRVHASQRGSNPIVRAASDPKTR